MASRLASSTMRATFLRNTITRQTASRHLSTSRRALAETPIAPTAGAVPVVKRPVGAFRGGLTGFLLGSVLAGASMYYYVLDEYRVSNELLTEDIFNLRTTLSRIEGYIAKLEGRIAEGEKKRS